MAYCKPEKTGKDANPNGRPKGETRTTCIRKAIFNIFDNPQNESLEDFLQKIKKTEPIEFAKIMTKLAPQKVESDNKNENNLIVTFVGKNDNNHDDEHS